MNLFNYSYLDSFSYEFSFHPNHSLFPINQRQPCLLELWKKHLQPSRKSISVIRGSSQHRSLVFEATFWTMQHQHQTAAIHHSSDMETTFKVFVPFSTLNTKAKQHVVNKAMILLVLEAQLTYPSALTSGPDNMEMSWYVQSSPCCCAWTQAQGLRDSRYSFSVQADPQGNNMGPNCIITNKDA